MNHEPRMSCKRGDAILTNGYVFVSCSCGRWSDGPVDRSLARILHGTHADSERNDALDALDAAGDIVNSAKDAEVRS